MQPLTFLSIAAIALTLSCDQIPAQIITYGDHQVSQALPIQYPTQIDSTKNLEWFNENVDAAKFQNEDEDSTVMHAVLNPQTQQPFWYVPLPASWKIISSGVSDSISIEGPNGLIIKAINGQSFTYSDKADLNRWYEENDMPVKEPLTIEAVFSELLIPEGLKMGITLLTHYPLPEVAANNAAYTRQISGSSLDDVQKVEGSDWVDGEGNKVFIVFYYTELVSTGTLNWGYYLEMLKVQPSYFELAKKQFIHGISNKRFSKKQINEYNNQIADQKALREKTRYYSGDFHKDSTGKLVRDEPQYWKLDYISRDTPKAMGSDRTQQEIKNDSVNVNLVVNPFDSKEYLVGSGFDIYWINEKCQYIQSEDTLFDPNTFETQSGLWQQARLKVYN